MDKDPDEEEKLWDDSFKREKKLLTKYSSENENNVWKFEDKKRAGTRLWRVL